MSRPKKWDTMTEEEQFKWLENKKKLRREWYQLNLNKERSRKRSEKAKQSAKNWRLRNPEKSKQSAKNWYLKNKTYKIYSILCCVCGVTFEASTKNQCFCSDECKKAKARKKGQERWKANKNKPAGMNEKQWKLVLSERGRKFREKNPDYSKAWRTDNIELSRNLAKAWKKANPEKFKASRKRRQQKRRANGFKDRGNKKAQDQRSRDELRDKYVASLLGINTTLARSIPDLIEAKREQVKILRELKPITRKNKHNAQEPE